MKELNLATACCQIHSATDITPLELIPRRGRSLLTHEVKVFATWLRALTHEISISTMRGLTERSMYTPALAKGLVETDLHRVKVALYAQFIDGKGLIS